MEGLTSADAYLEQLAKEAERAAFLAKYSTADTLTVEPVDITV